MKKKIIRPVITLLLLWDFVAIEAAVIELPLACEGQYNSGRCWTGEFNLGVTFREIYNVYIGWSGTITAEDVCLCTDSNTTWPVDGKFLVRLCDSNSVYDISNAYVHAGEAAYPNSEPFSVRLQLPVLNYEPGELLVRFADGTLTDAERNTILASYGGGTVKYSFDSILGLSLVELPQNVTVQEAIPVLSNASEILHVEPNHIYHSFGFAPQYWHAILDGQGSIKIWFGNIYRSLDLCTVEYPIGLIDSATLVIEGRIIGESLLVPGDYPTIQSAIDNCNDGDVVIVSPGIYTGDGNRDIDFHGKAITVRSENGPETCIIDCNGTEAEPHRGFYFHNGEDDNSVLAGFSIINGYAGEGGAVFCYRSSPAISNCIISNNTVSGMDIGGGGICCRYSNSTITDCTITENMAFSSGGGICCIETGNQIINNCIISGNSGGCGGGICCMGGIQIISNCTVSGNSGGCGGGICYSWTSSQIIRNCTFSGNWANDDGGGIYNWHNSSTAVTNCTFRGNLAGNEGGGMYNEYYSNLTLDNCTLSSNLAGNNGGGISNDYYSRTAVTNCILWADVPLEIYGGQAIVTYSDVQGGWPGEGNINADPCFADPNNGDYNLKSEGWRWDIKRNRWTYDDVTSRCIDAGNPGSALGDELLSIPDDPNNIWGQNLRINMGAYGGTAQASMPPYDWAILGDLTNDGLVNLKDFAFQAAGWLGSADQQPGDLNRDSLIDISDLALLVEDWLRQTTWHE